MAAPTPREDPQRDDELRRRLYRPDATEEDRHRYESELGTTAPPAVATPSRSTESPAADPPPPRRPRRAVLLGVGAGVLVLLLGVAAVQQTAAPTLLLPRVPSQRVTAAPAPDEPVVRSAATGDAGVQQFSGRGPGTAPLDPVQPAGSGGRFQIMITVGAAAEVAWQARRVEVRLDGDQVVRDLGANGSRQARGVPHSYRYRGTPPTSLRVVVPSGVAWNLAIVPGR